MNVLVINCGSSSLKYQLINMNGNKLLAKGVVERIGIPGSKLTHTPSKKKKYQIEKNILTHEEALEMVLDTLVDESYGVIKSIMEINAIGHRVVHGGESFSQSVIIDDEVIKVIKDNIELAPLHNPPNVMGINACMKLMPNLPQVAVFDTAFHQTLPQHVYLYGIPYEFYEKYKIRKYGFHGTSHKYVALRSTYLLKKPLKDLKLITCHLGSGASVTAIQNGKSVETSMGFTPLEGLMMGTRSGDIDPAIVSFLMEKEGWTLQETASFLNKNCGILGISGISSDFRDLQNAADGGHNRSQLAMDRFAHMVKHYIGAYTAVMDGVDALVFTAGIGENSAYMRKKICDGLDYLGIYLDEDKNYTRGVEANVSKKGARVQTLVIPTNEELMIAKDTVTIVEEMYRFKNNIKKVVDKERLYVV